MGFPIMFLECFLNGIAIGGIGKPCNAGKFFAMKCHLARNSKISKCRGEGVFKTVGAPLSTDLTRPHDFVGMALIDLVECQRELPLRRFQLYVAAAIEAWE